MHWYNITRNILSIQLATATAITILRNEPSQLTSIRNYLRHCNIHTLTTKDAVIAAIYTTLHHALLSTALHWPTCSAWYVDKGWHAYNLYTYHTCHHYQNRFSVKSPTVGNPLVPCQPTWIAKLASLQFYVLALTIRMFGFQGHRPPYIRIWDYGHCRYIRLYKVFRYDITTLRHIAMSSKHCNNA